MAQQPVHLAIPLYQLVHIAQPTNQEWTDYQADVTTFENAETARLVAADPNGVFPNPPPEYTVGPNTATSKLYAAMLVTAWLNNGRALCIDAENTAMAAAAGAAAQQALAQAQAQGPQPQVGMAQLLQALQNLQAPAAPAAGAAAGPAAQPAPPRIKAALPESYSGNPREAKKFLRLCDNYFQLNAMTQTQKVLFTLQLVKGGEADHWRDMMLQLLNQPIPPLWASDWEEFKGEFRSRFTDPQEVEKAVDLLMENKVVQVTTARKFLDEVV